MRLAKGDVETALIDADIMMYRAAWKHDGGGIEEAYETIDEMFSHLFYVTKCVSYIGFLTGRNNFRKKIAVTKPYKGNRKDSIMPEHLDAIRDYLINDWFCIMVEDMEADDALGICQTEMSDETIICSIDKDLLQIAGFHYNWNKSEVSEVTPYDAERLLHKQTLMGDATDNIVGIPKVGEKKAEKFLDDIENVVMTDDLCLKAYIGYFKDPDIALAKMNETIGLVKIATSSSDPRLPEKYIIPEVSFIF